MATQANGVDRTLAYRVLRYKPNLVRDEWVNIGVLVFDPQSGERRMRLIEEPEEYARVRRLHPRADEELLRPLRDDLDNRFSTAAQLFQGNGSGDGKNSIQASADWIWRVIAASERSRSVSSMRSTKAPPTLWRSRSL